MHFPDGTIYKGSWNRGLQSGKATITLADGNIKEGYFSNNIFYGEYSPKGSDPGSSGGFVNVGETKIYKGPHHNNNNDN